MACFLARLFRYELLSFRSKGSRARKRLAQLLDRLLNVHNLDANANVRRIAWGQRLSTSCQRPDRFQRLPRLLSKNFLDLLHLTDFEYQPARFGKYNPTDCNAGNARKFVLRHSAAPSHATERTVMGSGIALMLKSHLQIPPTCQSPAACACVASQDCVDVPQRNYGRQLHVKHLYALKLIYPLTLENMCGGRNGTEDSCH
jgi:hypothetical protein